ARSSGIRRSRRASARRMGKTDLVFDRGATRFQVRAAGIALDRGRVLLSRAPGDDFWTLPGGRVGFHEHAAKALARELLEETGVEPAVGRLLWIVENHFEYGRRLHHEIGLYFLVSLPPRVARRSTFSSAPG